MRIKAEAICFSPNDAGRGCYWVVDRDAMDA
jgi:hypothetical protein